MLIGLCRSCIHRKWIENDRGSRFIFCELSKTKARFPKYPALPVLRCTGYLKESDKTSQRSQFDNSSPKK
jgi:hypothetical protein